MMHRFTKVPGSGDEEYFNEKRPVNVRVDRRAHLAEPSSAQGMLTNTSHHLGPVRAVGKQEVFGSFLFARHSGGIDPSTMSNHFAHHRSMFETVARSHRWRGTMDTVHLGRGLPQAQNGTCESKAFPP